MKAWLTGATAAAFVVATAAVSGPAVAAEKFITIGTGGVTGVYYPTGGSVCRLLNKERDRHGIRCTVESTAASVYNINAIGRGELDFGITQADWLYHAWRGTSKFEKRGPMEKLRSVFSIHAEPITVVARADAGIDSLQDLKGKRVNVGDPGSGTIATNEILFDAVGLSFDDFSLVAKLKSAEQAQALCDNKIDAYSWVIGHPSAGVSEATSTCDAKLIPVDGAGIDKLVEETPYYSRATIAGGLYEGNPNDIPTFGMKAVMVSSTDVSERVVYEFVKAVFENFDQFRGMHPAFAHLKAKNMATQALLAPVHNGAMRYYKEAGLR